jgi:hypothetical protein
MLNLKTVPSAFYEVVIETKHYINGSVMFGPRNWVLIVPINTFLNVYI